ncbi:uncharacterized protein LOC109607753 [Aethina tumida]|uniref:uncharacterized protein LOC109607753 n=1 Tax=Aethina tumida TaxID=116153 RepID=UPI00096AE3C0|nr:uncharacterized protein LOC109607753 [Aethina tumida]
MIRLQRISELVYFYFFTMKYVYLVCAFLILHLATGREISCNDKEFLCYDNKRFYQCVQNGASNYVIGELQNCPDGLVCNNDADLECDGEISDEVSAKKVSSKLLEVIERQVEEENENQIKNSLYNEF